jgi:ubiquinone biosynthesis protein COQ9
MLDTATPKGRIVAAALTLAAAKPWREITLVEIATQAGVTLVDLRRDFAGKSEILAAFTRAVDDAVMAKPPTAGPGEGRRDALFEVIMARFDALAPHKPALKSIAGAGLADPALIRPFLASQHWMLATAGIGTDGWSGPLRVAGLGSVYASVFRTWLADDDAGLARTMAALDRRLKRGESTITSIESTCDSVYKVATAIPDAIRSIFAGRGSNSSGNAQPGDTAKPR